MDMNFIFSKIIHIHARACNILHTLFNRGERDRTSLKTKCNVSYMNRRYDTYCMTYIKESVFCFSVTGSRRTKRNNPNSQLQQITKLHVYLVEGLSFWGTRSLLEGSSAHLVRPKI